MQKNVLGNAGWMANMKQPFCGRSRNMKEVKLTTRQINALRLLLERKEFSVADVAQLDYYTLIKTPGIGGKSIHIIREWLAGFGQDLYNCPAHYSQTLGQQRLQARLERAEKLLRKHGYDVYPPCEDVGLPVQASSVNSD